MAVSGMVEVCPQSTQREQTSQNGLTRGKPRPAAHSHPASQSPMHMSDLRVLTAQSQDPPQEARRYSIRKKGTNLPLAYMSKERLSREDVGYTEQARDIQNQGSVLLTHLQTVDEVCRQGKPPVWTGRENAAIFPSSLPDSSASKQKAN